VPVSKESFGGRALNLEEHLAVPYVVAIESIEMADGTWIRRAAYPELPDCVVEGESTMDVLASLEQRREQVIRDHVARGLALPVPRAPLRTVTIRPTARSGRLSA
jgi:predicted RNase H-like HicB family nuclease